VSIEDIARAAEVARPMVHHHFEAEEGPPAVTMRPGARRLDDHDATFAAWRTTSSCLRSADLVRCTV